LIDARRPRHVASAVGRVSGEHPADNDTAPGSTMRHFRPQKFIHQIILQSATRQRRRQGVLARQSKAVVMRSASADRGGGGLGLALGRANACRFSAPFCKAFCCWILEVMIRFSWINQK
jgi:hypothetical protein